jgi:predicted PurR-regulated permease PerM
MNNAVDFSRISKSSFFRAIPLIAVISAIGFGCLAVLAPFIPAIILGVIFTLATWPAFVWVERKVNHRTTLAAAIVTTLLALGFVVPLILIANSLTANFSKFWSTLVSTIENSDGLPPEWVQEIPFISDYAMAFWEKYLSDMQTVSTALKDNAKAIYQHLLSVGTLIGRGVIDLSFGVFITFFLLRHGVQMAERLNALIDKFIGTFGQHLLDISKKTIISIIYGVVGTAVVQGTLAAIGFTIAGVPGAVFLGLMTFFFSFIPMAPPLIWIPATLWLFAQDHIGMGIFMGLWGLLVISASDNIIRPYFIYLGSNLPLLLVLLGVFGGIIAFGFIGLFIGPTLLALAYTLLLAWSNKTVPLSAANDAASEV